MAALNLFLTLFVGALHLSAAEAGLRSGVAAACSATRFPDQCEPSISQSKRLPQSPTPLQIIQTAVWVSSENLQTAKAMVEDILNSSAGNPNRTDVALRCREGLGYSDYRISLSSQALPSGRMKDARAWLSASLHYQSGCWSLLQKVNDTRDVLQAMSFLYNLTLLSSNALSMAAAYDIYGNDTNSWAPPRTERDGFWEKPAGSVLSPVGSGFRFPENAAANVTVCKDGSNGCLGTVQAAVEAAPPNATARFVIHIKEGVYEETVRVPLEKKNLVFLGDGMGKTVITGSLNVGQPGMSTYNSATVGVVGDGFMASGVTFENTAGPEPHQAVAFRSDSDLSIIHNCEFLGHQDTLYPHALRQFYNSCRIEGNVDFIFGNAAAVFQHCQILVRPREPNPEASSNNPITAHARADPAQSTGFVFQNCLVNGTEEFMSLYRANPETHRTFLGRPWKEYARTVFIHCDLEDLVSPLGWMPWDGDIGLKTLYYGEFQNLKAGSQMSNRVAWSNRIPPEYVSTYSVHNFIQGNEWIPK